jgi:hypothetical protein
MKKILLTLIFLCGLQTAYGQQEFAMPQTADYPAIAENGAKTSDFIPQNWKTLGEAKGDLNGDKIPDAAFVIQGTDPKFIAKNEGLGTDTFDTNPRMLLILFGASDGYKLAEKSTTFVAFSDYPTMEEPFDSIEIKNGVLQIKQHIFMSAGGWGTSNYTYKLRYQDGDFALIGADTTSVQRNTGEMESRSYNFLTRKVKISKGRIDNDKEKVSFRNFKLTKLQTLKNYPKAFEWEVEKDFSI